MRRLESSQWILVACPYESGMLWMPTGSTVIEISTGTQHHYRTLAEHLDLTCMSLLARKGGTTVAGHNGEFLINVKVLD